MRLSWPIMSMPVSPDQTASQRFRHADTSPLPKMVSDSAKEGYPALCSTNRAKGNPARHNRNHCTVFFQSRILYFRVRRGLLRSPAINADHQEANRRLPDSGNRGDVLRRAPLTVRPPVKLALPHKVANTQTV